jgi:hypothetical protein
MKKTNKKLETRPANAQGAAYLMMPWSCNHYPTYSEIEAHVPITGNFEIIADIHDTKGVDAEVVAGLITRAVNAYSRNVEMIAQMAYALELCLCCADCLSWEAEHEAEVLLGRAREIISGEARR